MKSRIIENTISAPSENNKAEQLSNIPGYALKVGEAGAPRLKRLNELCNPLSFKFIEQHISLKNKRILEIGCGVGIMASELARRSLPDGEVLATDISADQLKIAKEVAQKVNVKNIQFLQISAENIDQKLGKFDLIYCRFVLAHLHNSMLVIQKIVPLMHTASVLICEEPEDIQAMYCEPSEPIFETWKQAVFKQVEVYKSDFAIGKKLNTMFQNTHLKTVQSSTVQPVMTTSYLKHQLWQGIQEISALLIQSGFATEDEVKNIIHDLKIFADTSTSNVGFFKYTQIAAKKEFLPVEPLALRSSL